MRALVVVVLVGCDFNPLETQSIDARGPDGNILVDGSPDGPPAFDCLARWKTGPLSLTAPAQVANVNSPEDDRDPFISNTSLELAFVSRRPGNQNGDIYVASRTAPALDFGAAVRDDNVSSSAADSRLTVSGNDLQRIVSSTRSPTQGNFDLFVSTRNNPNASFSAFAPNLAALVNSSGNELDPELSFDGLTLYLAIDNAGNQAVAVASRAADNAAFSAPVPIIASDGDADPAVSRDELVILFSSNRPGGAGGSVDIWYATRPDKLSAFGTATNLTTINSTSSDGDPTLSRDGCTLYFASDRDGNYDIYVSTVIE